MATNHTQHHRRSIRISGYDYTTPGAYFITTCVHANQHLLGEVVDEVMHLSPYGQIVEEAWNDLPRHYSHLTLDAFCIMPNHVHGIIVFADTPDERNPYPVSEIVRAFKSFSARRINQIYRRPNMPFWQRNYYEVIIRSEREWEKIRDYIETNPLRWEKDKFYTP